MTNGLLGVTINEVIIHIVIPERRGIYVAVETNKLRLDQKFSSKFSLGLKQCQVSVQTVLIDLDLLQSFI